MSRNSDHALLVSNYIESAKLANRAIYFSWLFAAALSLLIYAPRERFTIPLLAIDADFPASLMALFLLHMGAGIVLLFAVGKCRKIKEFQFEEAELIETYPSLVHAHGMLRIVSMIGPALLVHEMLQAATSLGSVGAWIGTLVFAPFHIIACFSTFYDQLFLGQLDMRRTD